MNIKLDLTKGNIPEIVLSYSRCSSLGMSLSCLGFGTYLLDSTIPHLME